MVELLGSKLDTILEETSRSFYLSLKVLPPKIRSQVSLLYLLARTSDTIADSEAGEPESRLEALKQYNDHAQGRSDVLPDLSELAQMQTNSSESRLLDCMSETVASIDRFPDSDQLHIRRCLDIIVGGQSLDLERFSHATEGNIVSLVNDNELDDYAYRVAGSVGEFWTRMTLSHLFQTNSETRTALFNNGIRFGKALQMINILRDIPEDLKLGRCSMPSEVMKEHNLTTEDLHDSASMDRFRPMFDEYIGIASQHLGAAAEYIGMLPHGQFRLRGACMMPVLIGQRTLALLLQNNVLDAGNRIKVTRTEIKQMRNRTILALPLAGRSRKLLESH